MKRRDFLGTVAGATTLAGIVSREMPAAEPVEPEESLPGEPLLFNLTGCNVHPALLHRLSQLKPTLYRMHPAQSFMVWQLAMLIRDSVPEFTEITSSNWSTQKICGVTCESVEDFPKTEIWLYRHKHLIAKVTNIATPYGYNT